MKLRTKLLLGIGVLLLAMVVVVYVLPAFLIRDDVSNTIGKIHTLLVQEHQHLLQNQKQWLDQAFEHTIQSVNSFLYMLTQAPLLLKSLTFTKDNPSVSVWEGAARLAGVDPDIGFVQAHSPQMNQQVVVSPHMADLYPLGKLKEKNNLAIVGLQKGQQQVVYVALALPKQWQNQEGQTLYALFDLQKAKKEKDEFLEEISKLTPEFEALHLQGFKRYPFQQIDVADRQWTIKISLIQTLAPLVGEGLQIGNTAWVPEGVGRLDSSGQGMALLSDEAFLTTPLFDDQAYYEHHLPQSSESAIAQGSVVVTKKKGDHAFIGNTLKIDNHTYLSIGVPLSILIKELALSSHTPILLAVNSEWFGFDEKGHKILVKSEQIDKKKGVITLNQKPYFYTPVTTLEEGRLVFYELRPVSGKASIVSTLLKLETRLSNKISWQLGLIALGTMILVLLFVWRIGYRIITPIRKLALATIEVASGKYDEVTLPEVGKRRDEVATLTHSFDEMVKGLQEREKIRGVLDKVVSKDVAEEILRTQIQLGGEDRIVTILFGDIRKFTELTENVPPQKTIQMLNGCMTKISRVIEGEGGVIDKYVGDEVMALYGAPAIHKDDALRAVSSGILLIESLKKWNEERIKEGEEAIEMGVGIHTGLVVVGNMGAEDRLNYTVLGSNVNLASRLCKVAKPNQLIISEATLSEPHIKDSFYVNPLEPITLKGFKEPVSIYEVVGFKWHET